MEIPLKYGCNPHQVPARLLGPNGGAAPLRVLNGEPGYINLLDALTGWQLVQELSGATGKPAAASYKHVSPAGAAVTGPITAEFARAQFLDSAPEDPLARAYVRARGADRVSSFGDAAALSHPVGTELAGLLRREVSDLIIAPGYEPGALEMLASKKKGHYLVLQIDPASIPPVLERRDIFGFTLEQKRNDQPISPNAFVANRELPEDVIETLLVATIALKYTQSNSVCIAWNGQVIGMAAGQQSRIHCTRLACAKAEKWMLQTHPKVLALNIPPHLGRPERSNLVDQYILWDELSPPERDAFVASLGYVPEPLNDCDREDWYRQFPDLCMSSDAFIPFRDNLDRAARTGVKYVAHAGGALRNEAVHAAAEQHGIVLIETGIRCFLH
jgi:AICAR transformylase/IMP cyclohydrolase PurH